MAATRKTRQKNKPTTTPARPESLPKAIRFHLAKIRAIDAVYVVVDNNVVHVFSVVREFEEAVYDKLLKKERLIEKAFPDAVCEFHLRAHQGRKAHLAVPYGAEAVFVR